MRTEYLATPASSRERSFSLSFSSSARAADAAGLPHPSTPGLWTLDSEPRSQNPEPSTLNP
jgi:hypothetical protein